MRYRVTTLLLALSILLLPGTSVVSNTSAPASQLQLQHTPAPAQNSPQVEVEDIHDIKGPVPLSDSTRFLVPAIVAVTLLIIAALLFFFLKRRRRPQLVTSPPDVTALTELDLALSLMEHPLIYAERISTLLRQYIESRFQILSTRQTTGEFFSRLRNGSTIAEVDIKNHAEDLQECMEQCDIAKFARGTPNHDNMMRMDQAVRNFIETTRQKEQSAEKGFWKKLISVRFI